MRLLDSMIALAILVTVMLAVGGLFSGMARSLEVRHERSIDAFSAYAAASREVAEAGR